MTYKGIDRGYWEDYLSKAKTKSSSSGIPDRYLNQLSLLKAGIYLYLRGKFQLEFVVTKATDEAILYVKNSEY